MPGRFYTTTIPQPLSLTQGRTSVKLRVVGGTRNSFVGTDYYLVPPFSSVVLDLGTNTDAYPVPNAPKYLEAAPPRTALHPLGNLRRRHCLHPQTRHRAQRPLHHPRHRRKSRLRPIKTGWGTGLLASYDNNTASTGNPSSTPSTPPQRQLR